MGASRTDRGCAHAHPPGTNPSPLRLVDLDGHVVKAEFDHFFRIDQLRLLEVEEFVELIDKAEENVPGVGDDEPGVCADKGVDELAAEVRLVEVVETRGAFPEHLHLSTCLEPHGTPVAADSPGEQFTPSSVGLRRFSRLTVLLSKRAAPSLNRQVTDVPVLFLSVFL